MARLLYGCTAADYTTTSGGRVVPNAELTVWDAIEGGTQITDLTDYDGNAVATVISEGTGYVRFYGPDGENDNLWLDSGQNARVLVRPTVITADIGDGSILDEDINASAAIARTKIAGTALTAESTGVFSVLDYGADPTGVADSTAAIQAAIDAAAVTGGTVHLPAGDYKITAALEMRAFVSLAGAATGSYDPATTHGTRIIPVTPGQTAIILDATVQGIADVTFCDFSINGVATVDGCVGVEMCGEAIVDPRISNIDFRRLHFIKLGTGIWSNSLPVTPPAPSEWQNDGIRVSDCFFDEVDVGIHLTSQNCDFWHIDRCGIGFFDYGIYLERSGFVLVTASAGGASGGNAGSSFIYAGVHGALTVVSSQAEQVDHFYRLADDAPGNSYPMTFIGCVADAPFTYPGTGVGHKLVLIGCSSTTGTSVDNDAAGSGTTIVGLGNAIVPFNTGGANLVDLDPSPNVLSANRASFETDTAGWHGWHATVTRSTAEALHGLASMHAEIATASPGTVYGATGVGAEPVTAGSTWTFVVSVLAETNTPTVSVAIEYYDVAGTVISAVYGSETVVASGTWQEVVTTQVAPAGTVYACPRFVLTGEVGDAVYADCLGFWEGGYRLWRMPGYTVEGSRGGNAALASLLTQLEARGLITDSTTAS